MDRIPSILCQENFQQILDWFADPGKAVPEGAADFVTTLDFLYMTRTGEPLRRKSVTAAVSGITLKGIMESSAEDERKREVERRRRADEARRKALDAIAASRTAEAPRTDARIGDGQIPFTDENGFAEGGLDSLLLARAVGWHYEKTDMALTRGRPLSMTFLQIILYITYGTFLAERGTRLTDEHPQMWKYGPIFPRVYGKLSKGIPADEGAARESPEKDPALDEFPSRILRVNAGKKISDLTKTHTSPGSPWGRCLKRNPDKWATPLEDTEIRTWFRKTIDKNDQPATRG